MVERFLLGERCRTERNGEEKKDKGRKSHTMFVFLKELFRGKK
jgi:hypothetical protein